MTAAGATVAILLLIVCSCSTQKITTSNRHFIVDLNQEVILPCKVEDPTNQYGIVWMRGDQPLFLDGQAIDQEQTHYRLVQEGNNHALFIDKVEAFDEANYTCTISDPSASIKVVHILSVHTPPSVSISPKQKEVYPRFGEDLTLTCSVTGNPVPEKVWKLNGKTVPVDAKVMPNGVLLLPNVDESFSGVYECRARNKYQKEASASISVHPVPEDYEFVKPTVTSDRTYIPTKEGEDVTISCHYTGLPVPEAKWTLNGKSIDKNKHMIETARVEKNFTTTTLNLRKVSADEFGDYECSANNGIGTDAKTIHLNDKPGRPFLETQDNRSLSWTVESALPVDQYRVFYRRAGEDKFVDFKIFSSTKNDQAGEVWSRTEKLDFLKPKTEYELQVKAQNKQGLGSFAVDYKKVFIASDDSVEKGNANSASTLLFNIPTLLTAIYLLRQ